VSPDGLQLEVSTPGRWMPALVARIDEYYELYAEKETVLTEAY
jgi:hypothetical protein